MHAADAPDTICHHPEREHKRSMEGLLAYVPKSAARVLDCTGTFARRGALLKAHGVREVVALADSSAGIPGPDEGYDAITQGPLDFTELPAPGDPFDCIICSDALERLRNPGAFLEPLLERLAPGGLFIATVPNMQYHKIVCALTQGRWVYGDSGVWDRNNLRFFTAAEIKALLRRAGLGTCRIASLVKDDEQMFPRDPLGYVRFGNLRIGPLNDPACQAWLTEYYLALAVKPLA